MKKITVLLSLALLSLVSRSEGVKESAQEKFTRCLHYGGLFSSASSFRNYGLPPAEALRSIRQSAANERREISVEVVKQAINTVYFDPDFAYAGGEALGSQMRNLCLRDGKPQFQPLK